VRRGKVRDIYDFDNRLLFVASDRISAFDWDKESTPPALPDDIVSRIRTKYIEAFELLVDETFPWT
jgi:phosphoribosylaminoimidazole-succinocarboxamide synthase